MTNQNAFLKPTQLRAAMPFPGFDQNVRGSLAYENVLYEEIQEWNRSHYIEQDERLDDYGIDWIYESFDAGAYEDAVSRKYFDLYLEYIAAQLETIEKAPAETVAAVYLIGLYCCRAKFRPAGEWEMVCTIPQESLETLKSFGVIGEMWPESNSGCSYEFMPDPEDVFNCETGYGQELYEFMDSELLKQLGQLIPDAIKAQREIEEEETEGER